MLERILQQASALADELDKSQKLTLLKEISQRIDENPSLKNKITEFKKMSVALETKRLQGQEISFDEEKLIGLMYAEINFNEYGHRYLEIEDDLYDILNKVYEIIDSSDFTNILKLNI